MNLFSKNIIEKCKEIFGELWALDEDSRIEIINEIRLELHKWSPLAQEPVDCVQWIPAEKVLANDYNPNSVAPPRDETSRA